jgi:hypothetical protein
MTSLETTPRRPTADQVSTHPARPEQEHDFMPRRLSCDLRVCVLLFRALAVALLTY